MSDGRQRMLNSIRRSLRRGALTPGARAALERRLAEHPAGIVPGRTRQDHAALVDLFRHWATTYNATIAEVETLDQVAAAVQDYLKANNLPARIVMAPDPALDGAGWHDAPLLEIRRGTPVDADRVAVTGALAGVAETGTLVFASAPEHPTSLNLMPETHVVVLNKRDVVGAYEEVWARLRARYGEQVMPRTVNTITGPSRTGDIEQTLELGAHGPRRMHIVLVQDRDHDA
jgi:L-lactate dehydrogenase complex protein LldG